MLNVKCRNDYVLLNREAYILHFTFDIFFGWAIRFRTRTKTTKMSCATITP